MYIGKVSKITGLSIKAIRLYEERGLIHRPKRKGRYRVYSEIDIDILNLISEAKLLGVTLSQLQNVIVYDNGQVNWQRVELFLIDVKKRLLSDRIELERKLKSVETCIAAMNTCPKTVDSAPKGRD